MCQQKNLAKKIYLNINMLKVITNYRYNAKHLQFDWLKLCIFLTFLIATCKYQWNMKRKKVKRDI